jgi:hypothetical protein
MSHRCSQLCAIPEDRSGNRQGNKPSESVNLNEAPLRGIY